MATSRKHTAPTARARKIPRFEEGELLRGYESPLVLEFLVQAQMYLSGCERNYESEKGVSIVLRWVQASMIAANEEDWRELRAELPFSRTLPLKELLLECSRVAEFLNGHNVLERPATDWGIGADADSGRRLICRWLSKRLERAATGRRAPVNDQPEKRPEPEQAAPERPAPHLVVDNTREARS